eukprot:11409689-Alexandrium_andersonii.AAC.1
MECDHSQLCSARPGLSSCYSHSIRSQSLHAVAGCTGQVSLARPGLSSCDSRSIRSQSLHAVASCTGQVILRHQARRTAAVWGQFSSAACPKGSR